MLGPGKVGEGPVPSRGRPQGPPLPWTWTITWIDSSIPGTIYWVRLFPPLLLLLFCCAPLSAAATDKRPLILVLSDAKASGGEISADSFTLALLVHLKPDKVDIELSSWSAPPTREDQEGLAGHRCSKRKAVAVVWYTVQGEGTGGEAAVEVHMVSFLHGAFQRQSLKMGRPQPGIERSMAISVHTLVSAHLARLPSPTEPEPEPEPRELKPEPPTPAPPVKESPPEQVVRRVEFGASYDLDIFPLGDEIRHGPTFGADLKLWRRLHAHLGVGYRITEDGSSKTSWWSRNFLTLDLSLANRWSLNRRLTLLAGGNIRGTAIFSRAGRLAENETDEATLWELSIGLVSGAQLRIWSRISTVFGLRLAWLPVGHQLSVGGLDVVDPGAFEASVALGLLIRLL